MQQVTEDPDLKKEPETLKREDKEEIEEINIEDGGDKDDGDEAEEVEVELDFNDPTILRLLRVSIKVYSHGAIAKGKFSFDVLHGLNSLIKINSFSLSALSLFTISIGECEKSHNIRKLNLEATYVNVVFSYPH